MRAMAIDVESICEVGGDAALGEARAAVNDDAPCIELPYRDAQHLCDYCAITT